MSVALESALPGLSARLDRASSEQQRAAALAAARMATMRAGLADLRIEAANQAVGTDRFGNSPERDAIEALLEELDNAAWILQEAAGGGASNPVYLLAFRKARAAGALWSAMDEDPLRAAIEAIYEAHHAIADADALRLLVDKELSRDEQT